AVETFANMPPFAVEVKVPPVMTVGEEIELPVTLTNNRRRKITLDLHILCPDASLSLDSSATDLQSIQLAAREGKTIWVPVKVMKPSGLGHLYVKAKSTLAEQSAHHTYEVQPQGFPFSMSVSGADAIVRETITLGDPVPQSVGIQFEAYADLMQQMQAGRDAMLREPHGCFEQTSSSSFPNVLALHLMESVAPQDDAFRQKALDYIQKGHDRMKTFETPGKGFSLWGRNPANLNMSARGLMQFMWMARVYPQTDREVIRRTQKWLLARRNGQGRFKTKRSWRYQEGEFAPLGLHALVSYALASSGSRAIGPELDWMYHQARQDTKAYSMALCSRALFAAGDSARGKELVRQMMRMRQDNGIWKEDGRTALGGYGSSFQTELNALCLLAALDSRSYSAPDLASTVSFLQAQRKGGRFGSTMTTVLVLEAFGMYQEQYRQTYGSGTLELWVDGQLYQEIQYNPEETTNVQPEDQRTMLTAGIHTIEVRQQGTGDFVPFSVDITGFARTPPSQSGCRVALKQSLSTGKVQAGEIVGLDVAVQNLINEKVGDPMLRIGIPSGLTLALWQLKEMQERGEFAYYEIHGGELWLYLEYLEPNATARFHLDLTATIPGKYEASASSGYLYYNDQHKHWQPGLNVTVVQ
ncbi:MAG: hypothetical protein AAFV07_02495, partial [Bacteroidota bacterium]